MRFKEIMNKGTFTAEKIWNITRPPWNGEVHPDLVRFKGHFYCQSQEHGGNRILRSQDGKEWETVQLGRIGFMFSITPRNTLMLNGVTRTPDGELGDSYTRFSEDGIRWSNECHFPSGKDTVMFRVDWHDGVGYSVAYTRKDATGTLYRTHDGIEWETVKRDFFPPNRGGNEASLAFEEDGRACCLLRGDRKTPVTCGFSAGPEYTDWEWMVPEVDWYRDGNAVSADEAIRAPFGAPRFMRLSDGRLLAYGRVLGPDKGPIDPRAARKVAGGDSNDPLACHEHASVTLFEFDGPRHRLTRLADFPGYSHYHGMVEYDRQVWIACGSADSVTEVWMLKVPLDALPFPCEKRIKNQAGGT